MLNAKFAQKFIQLLCAVAKSLGYLVQSQPLQHPTETWSQYMNDSN